MSLQFQDFLIRIQALDPESKDYPVEATLEDGRFATGAMRLNLDLLLATEVDTEGYGLALFEALFAGTVGEAFDLARGAAEAGRRKLRIRLWIDDDAPEIQALPWERMHLPGATSATPLACSEQNGFSRFHGLNLPQPPPIDERPLQMLAAIANPLDLPPGLSPIDVEAELRVIGRALSEVLAEGLVKLTVAAGRSGVPPNVRSILSAAGVRFDESLVTPQWVLAEFPRFHLVHFVGHGFFRQASAGQAGTAALYLEDDEGRCKVVREEELVAGLTSAGQLPHLVFLAACESARQDATNPLVGLAPRLTRAGVPAVVAMQDRVPMETARLLTSHFYSNLLRHGVVDLAMNQARRLLFNREEPDWATPVLFSRLEDNLLIQPLPEEEPSTPAIPLPPARYWANLGGLLAIVCLLTFWYQRHLAEYLVASALLGGAVGLAMIGGAVHAVWKVSENEVKSLLRRALESKRGAVLIGGLTLACGGLLAGTSSVYVTLSPEAGQERSYEVQLWEDGAPLTEVEALNQDRTVVGEPFFFRLRGLVELRVVNPPIFESVESERRVWSSVLFPLPRALKLRRFQMVRLVPNLGLTIWLQEPGTPLVGSAFTMTVFHNDREIVASRDLRRYQSFYLGETDALINARRAGSEADDEAVLRQQFDESDLPKWREASSNIILPLKPTDRLRVEVRRNRDNQLFSNREVDLSTVDDQKTETILLEEVATND